MFLRSGLLQRETGLFVIGQQPVQKTELPLKSPPSIAMYTRRLMKEINSLHRKSLEGISVHQQSTDIRTLDFPNFSDFLIFSVQFEGEPISIPELV